ncbi:MAG: DUF455 family protein [Deltaproteobacteria bacterium]|nr:DUF455 family protein [Deltaproteobacteria bacterium]
MPADTPDWSPFDVVADGAKPPGPRALSRPEGVGDRMRIAAFAEIQAREAFRWGADTFEDAPDALKEAWRTLADEEHKHLGWLLDRMAVLGFAPEGRPVSAHLWRGLTACTTAHEFTWYMAKAEDRGRIAGERFGAALAETDEESAKLFALIAKEEADHIALAMRYYPASDRA